MPFTVVIFTVGMLAIAGTPPFNIFISEITIMMAGFQQGKIGWTILFMISILLIFSGMVYALSRMVFGEPEMEVNPTLNRWMTFPLLIPLFIIPLLAVYVPSIIDQVMQEIVTLFQGGF